jgi:hypothetical protein
MSTDAGIRESIERALHADALDEPAENRGRPFETLRSRPTLDYALRTIQQTQTQLSAMADTKASIMITVCSIVLTVGLTRFQDPVLRWPIVLLTGATVLSLLFAILAVMPGTAFPQTRDGGVDTSAPWFNLFFFGHFAELPRERFEDMLAEVGRDDARIYAMLARDIYGQGLVLARKKYRMLRWSYASFLAGVCSTVLGAIAVALRAAV